MPESGSDPNHYQLRCMDIWNGNRAVESHVSTPGLDIFVCSHPYQGQGSGGDVHYLSLCAGGVATRLILADVSGHGSAVAETSQTLRGLMRRCMNHKSQTRLVRELNREFSQLTQAGRFATAVVATYLNSGKCIKICNAGHPRPLLYRQASRGWSFLGGDLECAEGIFNLPLGIYEETAYQQYQVTLGEGDVLVFYTDAVTEAPGQDDALLGEDGLIRLVTDINPGDARTVGQTLLDRLFQFAARTPLDDDITLMVVRYSRSQHRTPGMLERINGYAKVAGLKSI